MFFFICLFLVGQSTSSRLREVFDSVMNRFQASIQSSFHRKYRNYKAVVTNVRFFHPILKRIKIEETYERLTSKNIIVTLPVSLRVEMNESPLSFFHHSVLFQATIDPIILKIDNTTDKIVLSELNVTDFYVDKYYDIMTSPCFKELQDDINFQIKDNIINVIRKNIEILLLNPNNDYVKNDLKFEINIFILLFLK